MRRAARHRLCSTLFVLTSGLCALVMVAGLAHGTLVPAPYSNFISSAPDIGGAFVAGGAALPFSTATFNGTLTSTVYQNDPSNPFGPGDLTFTYQLTNSVTSSDGIERLALGSF